MMSKGVLVVCILNKWLDYWWLFLSVPLTAPALAAMVGEHSNHTCVRLSPGSQGSSSAVLIIKWEIYYDNNNNNNYISTKLFQLFSVEVLSSYLYQQKKILSIFWTHFFYIDKKIVWNFLAEDQLFFNRGEKINKNMETARLNQDNDGRRTKSSLTL